MQIFLVTVMLCLGGAPEKECDVYTAKVKMHGLPYMCMLHAQKLAKQHVRGRLLVRKLSCKPLTRKD